MKKITAHNINPNKLCDELQKNKIIAVGISNDKKENEHIAQNTWITFEDGVDTDLVQQIIDAHDPTPLPPQQTKEELTIEGLKLAGQIATKSLIQSDSLSIDKIKKLANIYPAWEIGIDYKIEDLVEYEENLYEVIQEHTSQGDWTPNIVPALFKSFSPEGVIPEWVQPLGEHDAYQMGDKVTHKDKTWASTEDDNVWEPGVHGWIAA